MKRYLVSLSVLGLMGTGFAKEPGESGASFLKVGQSVRQISLGGAGSALYKGAESIFANPAGLAETEKKEANLLYSTPLNEVDDLSMSLITGVIPTSYGVLGGGIIYYSYGNTPKYNNGGARDGDWSASDLAIIGSYARKMGKDLMLGGNLKLICEKIDDSSGSAFGADGGFVYKTQYPGLSLAGVVQNLGSKLKLDEKGYSLPLTFKAGCSLDLSNTHPFVIVSDISLPNDNNAIIGLGVEAGLLEMFKVRAGYKSGQDEGSGFACGLGMEYLNYSFDFAFQPFGNLGDSYYLSIGAGF